MTTLPGVALSGDVFTNNALHAEHNALFNQNNSHHNTVINQHNLLINQHNSHHGQLSGQHTALANGHTALANGHTALGNGITTIDGKVDVIDGKIDVIDGKVDVIDGKIDVIDGKVDVIDGKVDVLDGKIDDVQAQVDANGDHLDELWGDFIEDKLVTCAPIASLFLPVAFNGNLENVRDVVGDRIQDTANAGMNVTYANLYFARGNTDLAANRYKAAYSNYCQAYKNIIGGIR